MPTAATQAAVRKLVRTSQRSAIVAPIGVAIRMPTVFAPIIAEVARVARSGG